MALVQCPKCGESISNTVGKCIYCGVEFSVCSECGNLILDGEEFCRSCGAARADLQKAALESAPNVIKMQKSEAMIEKEYFETKNFLDETIETRKRRDRKFRIISMVLRLAWLGFILLILIPLFQEMKDDLRWLSGEAKARYIQKHLIEWLAVAIGYDFVFGLGRVPPEIVHTFTADKTQKEDLGWLGKEKYSKYFINWFKTQVGQAKISLDMRNLLTAAYVLENPNAQSKAKAVKILTVVSKAWDIFASMILFLYLFISMDNFYGDSGAVKLVVTVALFYLPSCICLIVVGILESSIKKEVNQWSVQFQSAQNIKA